MRLLLVLGAVFVALVLAAVAVGLAAAAGVNVASLKHRVLRDEVTEMRAHAHLINETTDATVAAVSAHPHVYYMAGVATAHRLCAELPPDACELSENDGDEGCVTAACVVADAAHARCTMLRAPNGKICNATSIPVARCRYGWCLQPDEDAPITVRRTAQTHASRKPGNGENSNTLWLSSSQRKK